MTVPQVESVEGKSMKQRDPTLPRERDSTEKSFEAVLMDSKPSAPGLMVHPPFAPPHRSKRQRRHSTEFPASPCQFGSPPRMPESGSGLAEDPEEGPHPDPDRHPPFFPRGPSPSLLSQTSQFPRVLERERSRKEDHTKLPSLGFRTAFPHRWACCYRKSRRKSPSAARASKGPPQHFQSE